MTSQRILELLLRAWYWLPVRGRVGVTILALAQLYWVWRFYLAYVRAPWVLYRENVIPPDRTRTLDPVYSEPIDQELLAYLELTERKMMALGFSEPHRTTDRTTYPLPAVGSSLEHKRFGDQATIVAMRPPRGVRLARAPLLHRLRRRVRRRLTLLTSNVRMPRFWPDARKLDHVRIPHVTDPAVLYRLHRLRVIARRSDVAQKKTCAARRRSSGSSSSSAATSISTSISCTAAITAHRRRAPAARSAARSSRRGAGLSLAQHRPVVAAPARARR